MKAVRQPVATGSRRRRSIRLFLSGDVMTGRGVDQVLAHPCAPELHEDYVQSALEYVRLAEETNGPVPRRVEPSYIWGAALEEWGRMRPDARIVNLETSITHSDAYVRKGVNYRMSPENASCLVAANIDCCVLANNHVTDWGCDGLSQTLDTLERLKIKSAGAGRNLNQAAAPAVLDLADKGRVLIFSFGSVTSGIPADWGATPDKSGINLLTELSEAAALRVAGHIDEFKEPGDLVIVSVHWGVNWGYKIPAEQRRFAHRLIDNADVSIVHGHSSHHAKAVEVYRGHPILYGCGDFLNDYEGIHGQEEYRSDLALMYFVDLEPSTGRLLALEIIPLQIKKLQLVRPSKQDIAWIQRTLDCQSLPYGSRVELTPEGRVALANVGLQSRTEIDHRGGEPNVKR
jgi:poly-gamma-glutamate capsule biosynthesis protein CapA/YwtB (metallophosphatase superfamily)